MRNSYLTILLKIRIKWIKIKTHNWKNDLKSKKICNITSKYWEEREKECGDWVWAKLVVLSTDCCIFWISSEIPDV